MKGITEVIIGAVIVIVVILGVLQYQKNKTPSHTGSLYIGVTDAASTINGVSDINLSVKKVEVYSATKGWSTVSSDTKAYDLLTLNAQNKTQLYAKANVPSGTYEKVRVTLGDATVKTTSGSSVKAALPSSYVVLDSHVNVADNTASSVTLDVMGDKSLHKTSDGGYVFAPVVNSEARSNPTVSMNSDNTVSISGGTVDSNTSAGVDLTGMSKPNFSLTTDNTLKVNSSTVGGTTFMLGGKTYTQSADTSSDASTTSTDSSGVNVNTNTGVKVTY